jgi:hypothetical protein
MKAVLLAKSSHGEPYKVEFLAADSGLKIFCHCQAGMLHRMCKHKQAFIDGNAEILFDSTQAALLSEIHSWPQFKILQKHLEAFSERLAEIQNSIRELDKKEKAIKAELGKGLSFGFELKH